MNVWPRRLINFPIILLATCQQLLVAFSLLYDQEAHHATSVYILSLIVPVSSLSDIMFISAGMAIGGFWLKRKINTILFLIPQQLLLYLSAGGSFEAIWKGHFADGVIRGHAFILADQAPVILMAVFHTWAMVLIMLYAGDVTERR